MTQAVDTNAAILTFVNSLEMLVGRWLSRTLLLAILMCSVAQASELQDFRAASAEAANKFHPGYQYIIKFEDWISNAAVEALEACDRTPIPTSHVTSFSLLELMATLSARCLAQGTGIGTVLPFTSAPLAARQAAGRLLVCSDPADRRASSDFEGRSAVSNL